MMTADGLIPPDGLIEDQGSERQRPGTTRRMISAVAHVYPRFSLSTQALIPCSAMARAVS